jgi:hypothetical protein
MGTTATTWGLPQRAHRGTGTTATTYGINQRVYLIESQMFQETPIRKLPGLSLQVVAVVPVPRARR